MVRDNRWIVTLLCSVVFASLMFPQNPPPNDDDLYSTALKASIVEMVKRWGHIDDAFLGKRTDYRRMIVQPDPSDSTLEEAQETVCGPQNQQIPLSV